MKTKSKVVKNWLLSAKQNLEALSLSSDRNVRIAQAQALVSIAEDLDELVRLVREAQEDVYCSRCSILLPLQRIDNQAREAVINRMFKLLELVASRGDHDIGEVLDELVDIARVWK